jgi:hypothetical protein
VISDAVHSQGPETLAALRALRIEAGHLSLSTCGEPACAGLLDPRRATIAAALPTTAGDPTLRAEAARLAAALAPTGDDRLAALLSDPEEAVVRATAEGLAGRAEIEASLVAPLARVATDEPSWVSRLAAVRALGRAAGGDEALARALSDDAFAFVREAAAESLAAHHAGRSALEAAAAADPEPRVRAAARAALAAPDPAPRSLR